MDGPKQTRPSSALDRRARELIRNAEQNEQVLRRYQEYELLLLDSRGLGELLKALLRTGLEFFRLDAVELWLYDPDGALTELLSDESEAFEELSLLHDGRPLDRLYGQERAVQLVSCLEKSALPVFQDRDIRSAALLPLMRQGEIVGSLHFGARGQQRFTSGKSTEFISHLASVVALCIENAVNQERLHRLSMYDPLTQVKNRRAFHLALDQEVSRAARSGDPLSLLFVDLDHFKSINDTYGHPMGDKVLREVARFMADTLRKVDHVCRYGGEEFSLILPNADETLATDIAERLRTQVAAMLIDNDENPEVLGEHISVTLSIGACCWRPGKPLGKDGEAALGSKLIEHADKGVYAAKAGGRNQVSFVPL